MKAELFYRDRIVVSEDTICEMVIWRLHARTQERPHGLKYRLHFGKNDGTCIVRYDNEQGKGDHRHYGGIEEPYQFTTIEKLITDFIKDVHNAEWR